MQVTNDHGRGLFADIHHMCTAVFVVRTWLLWGGAKWVLFALIGGLALSSALSIYYISIDLQVNFTANNRFRAYQYLNQQGFRIIPTVSPQLLPGCLFRVSPTIWRPILFPFLYETFVIALTVTKVMMTPNRVPVVMRLFLDGTLYYVVVATVLLLTTIGAAYTPTRVLVIGSGFHTACISVGCSRLVLSLHSWAHENKPRSVAHSSQTRLDVHKHRISTPSFSTHSKGPAPTQPQYELVPRTAPDIGVGRVTTSTTATSVPGAIRFSLPHRDVPNIHSVLPDIERPSLPTRMWTNSSAVHTRESQRSYRPPRSSSLYPVMLTDQWNEPVQPLTYPTGAEENRERKGHSLIEGQRLRPLSIQRTYNVI
ncbi:hypothetical protein AG1IA_02313 [Rhizoctonia solani AG-1 IA]|uniref:Uncharacterized protein n=1 Tax=Thanatephorus cucumeris (strain AG1-IA) TaxID=983506 RepID=L8X0B0_THACA|nr:hypothetical protein AG1IA_02313 [Rhizoctonia solani AG-1 IA]